MSIFFSVSHYTSFLGGVEILLLFYSFLFLFMTFT